MYTRLLSLFIVLFFSSTACAVDVPPAETEFLCHFNGADAETAASDVSLVTPNVLTFNGNAQLDTAQSVFGGSSLLLDGTGDYISMPDSDDWAFGTNNLTISLRVRFNLIPGTTGIGFFTQSVDASNRTNFYFNDVSNLLQLLVADAGVNVLNITASWTPSTNTFYHVLMTRDGNSWRMFIDGTQIGSTVTDADGIPNRATGVRLGQLMDSGGTFVGDLNGWIDEFLIINGAALRVQNFTVESREYGFPFGRSFFLFFD